MHVYVIKRMVKSSDVGKVKDFPCVRYDILFTVALTIHCIIYVYTIISYLLQ